MEPTDMYLPIGIVGLLIGIGITWIWQAIRVRRLKINTRLRLDAKNEETERLLTEKTENYEAELSLLKEQLQQQIDKTSEELDKKSAELESQIATLTTEVDTSNNLLKSKEENEKELNQKLQETLQLKEKLEKDVSTLRDEIGDFSLITERLKNKEYLLEEERGRNHKLESELDKLKNDMMNEVARRATAEEKMARILSLEDQIKTLDEDRSNLLLENAELKKTQARLDKLEEIKDLYDKTLEENNILKQQSILRHFLEIKNCLDKAVHAYNKTCGVFDRKVLVSARELLDARISTPSETKQLELLLEASKNNEMFNQDHSSTISNNLDEENPLEETQSQFVEEDDHIIETSSEVEPITEPQEQEIQNNI